MFLADFCPCPEGDSPSAKRQYDAVIAGCVPVVASDDALWAFSNEAWRGLDGPWTRRSLPFTCARGGPGAAQRVAARGGRRRAE